MDQDHDRDTDALLRRLWNDVEPDNDAGRHERGLKRIDRFIYRRKAMRLARRALLGAAAAAVALLLFWGGMRWSAGAPAPTEQPATQYVLLTATGSVGEFVLPDGSRVWLNEGSQLKYSSDFLTSGRRDVTLTGEAYFDVKRDTQHPFAVSLNHMKVEVLGTTFDVRSYKNNDIEDVVLRSGSVKVYDASGREQVTLKPDERFCYDPVTGNTSVCEVSAKNYCQWFESELVFDNVPLQEILVNIERRYNVDITVGTGIDPAKRLSVTVTNEPLHEILSVLCSLLRGHYTHDTGSNEVVLSLHQ